MKKMRTEGIMKTAVMSAPFKIEIIDTPVPEVGPDEALVRVAYAGICGTDIDIYENQTNFEIKFPHISGHEWSGIITEVGKAVKMLKPGDRVVGDGIISCNNCNTCIYGNYSYCLNNKSVGTSEPSVPGAFKEFMVMPERHLFKIPDNVSLLDASLAEPAAVAARSVEEGRPIPGNVVFVFGTGAIGFFAVQYARIMGAQMVILAGRNDKKLEVARKFSGADCTINIRNGSIQKLLKEAIGEKEINLIIEASGNLQALHDSLEIIGKFGRISIPGSYPNKEEKINIAIMPEKEISWIFVNGIGGAQMFHKILNYMSSNRLNTKGLITEIFDLEDFEKAMKLKLKSSDSIKTVIRIDKNIRENS